MVAVQLRPGNAGSNTALDHIAITRAALAQLPGHQAGRRPGRRVLTRTDGAGSSHAFLDWLSPQRLSYSVGFALPNNTGELLALMDESVWTPAYSSGGQVREGAWVAELTGMLNLTGWPKGMRVIARKERPHPGAQLRITDADGLRVTAFATNSVRAQLPDLGLELGHRRRARAEDRIRCAKDTWLRNLPLHSLDSNRIWCAIVTLAAELTAWMQLLALSGTNARRWEPKRLRLRLFTIAANLTRHSRQAVLTLNQKQPWATLAHQAVTALRVVPAPGTLHAESVSHLWASPSLAAVGLRLGPSGWAGPRTRRMIPRRPVAPLPLSRRRTVRRGRERPRRCRWEHPACPSGCATPPPGSPR